MRLLYTILFLTAGLTVALPQAQHTTKRFAISGFVHDGENKTSLSASTVSLQPGERHVQADGDGFFQFVEVEAGNYLLTVNFLGYEEMSIPLLLVSDTLLHLHLQPVPFVLPEVAVSTYRNHSGGKLAALPVEEISRDYLIKHNATNFAQTLASVAGVSSMDIGAGLSKPIIRGFGFSRVAVVDRGIVQQNQQWGADHGLEIDQYDVDYVVVHKGPMSLFHGSDAMGGVIEILPPEVPQNDLFWGDATLIGKSNNDLLGASVVASKKTGNLFFRGRITAQSYGDYRMPSDTIEYLTWKLPVHDKRMKNTAGREYNLSFSSNYAGEKFNSWLHISHINTKNGFFPGAHGIPSPGRLEPDGAYRNIEFPYSTSTHFKLVSNSELRISDSGKMHFDFGYQTNHREELSQFHTHYSNQLPPVNEPDLELQFKLDTHSANVRYVMDEGKQWSKVFGLSTEYQHNKVGGYSFLLPGFDRFSAGAFWLNSYKWNENLTLMGGLRYETGKLTVDGFYDPVLEAYLVMQGYDDEQVDLYAQRAADINKTFNDISGSVGFSFVPDTGNSLQINLGSSFRYPGANELASNGVHHGAFRHEMGNSGLEPEKGYQIDLDYQHTGKKVKIRVSPFAAWFSNYIYLEPTGDWSVLPHTGQIYRYTQAEAFMAGGELKVAYDIDGSWRLSSDVAYLYLTNLSDNYPLPFSPPTAITTNLAYAGVGKGVMPQFSLEIENRWVMAQHRIAKNEERTPGTNLWNLSAQAQWQVGGRRVITQFRTDNIFNRAYLNHLSFYRKLNAPEPGRNIQLILKIPF
ncbi:MAG: TonB-dependent receptor [Proteiniphilum sp.]|nr:TonB-dependent receptor [Proteiniphilum sp.]